MINSEELVGEYAEKIRPLIEPAALARGPNTSSANAVASREYSALVLGFSQEGGNMTALSRELEVPLVTLNRRLRSARVGPSPLTKRVAKNKDPQALDMWVARIREARKRSMGDYRDLLVRAHDAGISLTQVASHLGVSYYSLYNAVRTHAEKSLRT